MRLQPYRNDCIITVIRDMYFSGGTTSFTKCFRYLFPTYESHEGVTNYEVPIPMVALVATVVSHFFLAMYCAYHWLAVCCSLRVVHW